MRFGQIQSTSAVKFRPLKKNAYLFPEVGGLKFNSEMKLVLSHSAAGLEGYEVVFERLIDKEKNQWEETAGCDDIRQVSGNDFYPV